MTAEISKFSLAEYTWPVGCLCKRSGSRKAKDGDQKGKELINNAVNKIYLSQL